MIEPETEHAIRTFLARISGEADVVDVLLFGSRARHHHRPESDADVAVLLRGKHGKRLDAALRFADAAFDVMLETGILIEAVPLWEDEWAAPETFANPSFIANIQREGVRL
ncbi:MAG: uncharacterized protein QG619_1412 [Pseudomonadota bacterium]|nr:uncharacterized protein [Pseudomonadota bacterium]